MSNDFPLIQFNPRVDERGSLVALEGDVDIPFAIARVYYLYDVNASRGFHAHRNLKQVAICMHGACAIVLDDGDKRQRYYLDTPSSGLFINTMIWHEVRDCSNDCVLMVLASEPYNKDDYIHDYETFKQLAFLQK